ncbi:MAG: cytochrome c biogenesis protein CcsA [Selenomonadaceae bacterium]|nr:cytochrome c biogenesis protein CcsA [Selenomonadaceae bacterium]
MKYLSYLIPILTILVCYLVFAVVPPAEGMGELVRIAFFHIPMAWLSVLAFLMSAWWAAAYLRSDSMRQDALSACSAKLGFISVLLATVSGAIFSKLTWGAYWNWDPRQTTIFVLILIYGAYLTLRSAIPDPRKRARTSAVYSLFSCLTVPFLVFIIPRLYFSLHPTPVLNGSGHVDMEPVMLTTLLLALLDATLIYVWLLFHTAAKENSNEP